ncbi:hypothetical protein AS026_13280 [Rhizobium altiplani]|uniref:Uncharacterized protein n=1 Tax=Rhizobium altiplani TaxID=1864509 RepID=A0A109JF65_9HYPH|nr:hypothetical protein AS026_13280 [Rhizobium altiplani]
MFCGRLRPIATSKINDGRLEGIGDGLSVASVTSKLISYFLPVAQPSQTGSLDARDVYANIR